MGIEKKKRYPISPSIHDQRIYENKSRSTARNEKKSKIESESVKWS